MAARTRGAWGGAFLLRLIYLLELRDSAFFGVLIGDSLEYDRWAREISAGDWLGGTVFYQAPLYPYLLGAFYSVAGHDPFGARVLQALFGAASAVLLAIGGGRFFDRRVGMIAGGLLAIYPTAIFFDGLIQKSSLDLLLLTALIAALGMVADRPARRWLALSGLLLGLLALNRENARILYPVVAAWLWMSHGGDWAGRAVRIAVFTAALAAVMVPVGLRNAYVGGEFLISTSQAGSNFYIGNSRGATGVYESLVEGRGNARYEREDATRLAEEAAGRTLTPGEVSTFWWRRALEDIRSDPAGWVRLMALKTWLTVAATEQIDTESIEAYATESRVLAALRWFTFGVVMALAVPGVWLTRRQWRRSWVLHGSFLALALSVIAFFVLSRYRFPMAPFGILFAAATLGALPGVRALPRRHVLGLACVALVLGIVLHIPARPSADDTFLHYGTELVRLGRPAEAVPLLERAAAENPAHAATRLDLALALHQTQQPDRAFEAFREAVRLAPSSFRANASLAIALHQQGRPREAIPYYEAALGARPDSVEVTTNLALAYQETGDINAAAVQFEALLARQPQDFALRLQFCELLRTAGRPGATVRCLQQASAMARGPDELLEAEYTLAQALLAMERNQEATASLERALAAARAAGRPQSVAAVEEALRIVRGRRP